MAVTGLVQEKLTTQMMEVTTLKQLLVACYGNQTEVGRLIGVDRATIRNRLDSGRDIYVIVKREGDEITFIKSL